MVPEERQTPVSMPISRKTRKMVRTPWTPFQAMARTWGKGNALAEGIAGKQQETQEKSSQERALEEDKEKQDQAECQQYTVFHKVILSAGE